MSDAGTDAQALLQAWREQGADRLDPLGFHLIAALERRATALDGAAREVLQAKLAPLLKAYAQRVAEASASTVTATPTGSALSELLHVLDTPHDDAHAARRAAYPAIPTLDHFRQQWSRLRRASQVRDSLKQVPETTGPLNSSALVHRSMALMSELSPGYLQHFLAYVDDLAWLEQMGTTSAPAPNAPQPANPRKRPRSKARARSE